MSKEEETVFNDMGNVVRFYLRIGNAFSIILITLGICVLGFGFYMGTQLGNLWVFISSIPSGAFLIFLNVVVENHFKYKGYMLKNIAEINYNK